QNNNNNYNKCNDNNEDFYNDNNNEDDKDNKINDRNDKNGNNYNDENISHNNNSNYDSNNVDKEYYNLGIINDIINNNDKDEVILAFTHSTAILLTFNALFICNKV
ncbi:7854_t:CDS:2, partial [Funneliformis caledonium]